MLTEPTPEIRTVRRPHDIERLNCLVLVGATKPIQHLCRLATFRWIARCTGKGKEAIQRSVRLATRAKVSTNRD